MAVSLGYRLAPGREPWGGQARVVLRVVGQAPHQCLRQPPQPCPASWRPQSGPGTLGGPQPAPVSTFGGQSPRGALLFQPVGSVLEPQTAPLLPQLPMPRGLARLRWRCGPTWPPGCLSTVTYRWAPSLSVHSLVEPPVPAAAPSSSPPPPCRQLGWAVGVNFHREGGPVPSGTEAEPGEEGVWEPGSWAGGCWEQGRGCALSQLLREGIQAWMTQKTDRKAGSGPNCPDSICGGGAVVRVVNR